MECNDPTLHEAMGRPKRYFQRVCNFCDGHMSDGGGTKFSCISGIIKEVQLKAAVVASFAGNMPYLGAFK